MWLIALKGLAGTGKSTLGRALSKQLGWPLLDKAHVKDRKALQIPAQHQTDWDAVQLIHHTHHHQADYLIPVPHLLVDTVRPPQECLIGIMRWLEQNFPIL